MTGWKTVFFGSALVFINILTQISEPLVQMFPDWMKAYGVGLIGIVVIILRSVTNSPVFKRPE